MSYGMRFILPSEKPINTMVRPGSLKEPTLGITDSVNCLSDMKRNQSYLSIVRLACCIVIYRRIILGLVLTQGISYPAQLGSNSIAMIYFSG